MFKLNQKAWAISNATDEIKNGVFTNYDTNHNQLSRNLNLNKLL